MIELRKLRMDTVDSVYRKLSKFKSLLTSRMGWS